MKALDLPSGFSTLISNEESMVLTKIVQHPQGMAKHLLDEREQTVARDLVKKDVLTRVKIDGKLYYRAPDMRHIWRI